MRTVRAVAPVAALLAVVVMSDMPAEAQQGAAPSGYAAAAPDIERMLSRSEAEEKQIVAELEESRPRLEMVRRRVVARGRAYYRLVRAGLLPAGGGFDALVDHAAHVERTRRALERDIASEGSLGKRITDLESKLVHVRAERGPLEVQREALRRARAALAAAEERRSAFARAFETSVRPDAVAVYGTDFGPSPDARAGFKSLRGRLPFPIAGRAEVNRVNHGGGPGVELLAAAGTAVRSVAAGRVSFADRYDDYGLTVILDHGDRYYSIYANLGSVDVHVGDSAGAGMRLGTVGSVDGAAPRLYFEIRHNAATIDPAPWLGL
ncbi:metalloendopeptidase [Minicystis rosea]|nr:metalloendopeptidase [Minicystis rosea]